jgi:hypothetical protein
LDPLVDVRVVDDGEHREGVREADALQILGRDLELLDVLGPDPTQALGAGLGDPDLVLDVVGERVVAPARVEPTVVGEVEVATHLDVGLVDVRLAVLEPLADFARGVGVRLLLLVRRTPGRVR